MQWRKAPPELISFLDEAAGSVERCEKRIMFGFPAYFINGNMFVAAHQESLVLRLNRADRDATLASDEGFAEFEPMPGRVMKEYLAIPEVVYRDKARFDPLLAKSAEYVRGLPTKKSARAGGKEKVWNRRNREWQWRRLERNTGATSAATK